MAPHVLILGFNDTEETELIITLDILRRSGVENQALGKFLQRHEKAEKFLGAICGAPFVFANNGIGKGGAITSFPPEKDEILKKGDYDYHEENVVVSKNIVTSRAPGTAFEFALKLTELLVGKDKADEIGKKLLIIQ
uniref:DJ-1/PfpI domain-containing protein n=1 Tax=Panagrolaimus superbus TaxID=310955 RepID=A0A914ZB68_9BILA